MITFTCGELVTAGRATISRAEMKSRRVVIINNQKLRGTPLGTQTSGEQAPDCWVSEVRQNEAGPTNVEKTNQIPLLLQEGLAAKVQ